MNGFDPWVRKIPWSKAWQPTVVFLPRESHGQRSLVGYYPWGHTESDMTEMTYHTYMCTCLYMCVCVYIYIYIYVWVCVCVCVRACAHMCVCKCWFEEKEGWETKPVCSQWLLKVQLRPHWICLLSDPECLGDNFFSSQVCVDWALFLFYCNKVSFSTLGY